MLGNVNTTPNQVGKKEKIKMQLLDSQQQRALRRMTSPECPNVFILWWKMGTGKTRLALFAFEQSGFKDLICVVRRVSFDDWVEEMEKCGLDYLVYANNYKGGSVRRLSKSKRRVLLISGGDLKNVPEHFPKGQMLVVDELYLFGNPKSKRSKLIQKISLFCSARLGLSGTIMPAEDVMTIFGQFMALQAQRVLASGTTEFSTRYQTKSKGKHGYQFLYRKGSYEQITKIVAPFVDVYMPKSRPTRTQILGVTKTKQQAEAINQLKEVYEWNNKQYDYALQILNVINGISNGWWIDLDGKLRFIESQKVEKCLALLVDIVSSDERVVVWCAYHNDIARLQHHLKDSCCLFTGTDNFDRQGWERNDYKVVLATEAFGASVNHFRNVKYAIYFSINYKLLDLQQSMARHERKDSSHDGAHYYFLQTKGTNDARIYNLVTNSEKSEKDLVLTLQKELFK